jgi:hypothetical protein
LLPCTSGSACSLCAWACVLVRTPCMLCAASCSLHVT